MKYREEEQAEVETNEMANVFIEELDGLTDRIQEASVIELVSPCPRSWVDEEREVKRPPGLITKGKKKCTAANERHCSNCRAFSMRARL